MPGRSLVRRDRTARRIAGSWVRTELGGGVPIAATDAADEHIEGEGVGHATAPARARG